MIPPNQPRTSSTNPVVHSTAHPACNPRGVSCQADRTRPVNATSPHRTADQPAQTLHRRQTQPTTVFLNPAVPNEAALREHLTSPDLHQSTAKWAQLERPR